jgi:head-tail adaptor
MPAKGRLDQRVTIQRATVSLDDHGGAAESWATYVSAWAQVRFGSAQERRSAAQEAATQSASFIVLANSLTLAITPLDRIAGYLGANWDIVSVVPDRRAGQVEITAVRKAA